MMQTRFICLVSILGVPIFYLDDVAHWDRGDVGPFNCGGLLIFCYFVGPLIIGDAVFWCFEVWKVQSGVSLSQISVFVGLLEKSIWCLGVFPAVGLTDRCVLLLVVCFTKSSLVAGLSLQVYSERGGCFLGGRFISRLVPECSDCIGVWCILVILKYYGV